MDSPRYIDVFSGCGGLSLGLGRAGWHGVVAIERDPMAFATFQANLIEGKFKHFDWPEWFPQSPMSIEQAITNYADKFADIAGKIDLVAGGPPCQGFSTAGRRRVKDPRNSLSKKYIELVKILRPKALILENVQGFKAAFKSKNSKFKYKPYSEIVQQALASLGYEVYSDIVHASRFGVPQNRSRFILIALNKRCVNIEDDPFAMLESIRTEFLKNKALPTRQITVKQAIGDLEVSKCHSELTIHSVQKGRVFKEIKYKPPNRLNMYQKMIRQGINGHQPTSMRLPNHKFETIKKFKLIQKIARPGVALNEIEKEVVGTRKQAICVLDSNKPSNTLTTLPDDIIHYSEPRILTVREYARIQSFPDSFIFKGNYTTGGLNRTKQCPRYTQVGNAVPPLLSEVLGKVLMKLVSS